jgi:two-component sensor histidine kinase
MRFVSIILIILVSPTKLWAQKIFVMDSTLSKNEKVDVTSYLYHIGQGWPMLVTEVLNEMPVNQRHSFLLHIKNNAVDSAHYSLQFGNRYVNAYHVINHSVDGEDTLSISTLQNTIPIHFASGEEKHVSFELKELDRLNPNKVSVHLIAAKELVNEDHQLAVTQSFFLGLFAFLTLFNLTIFFVTQWKVYIKYTVYIFSALLYFLYYYGFLQEAFPAVKNISINLVSTWYYLVYIFYFLFLNEFGQYKKYSPWAYKLLNIGIINKCIQLIYETILNPLGVEFIYSSLYKNIILVAEIALMIFIIYFILKNKNVRGKIVIVASLMLIIGAILGQLDFDSTTRGIFIQLGITAELLTFSVGLGYLTKEFYTGQQKAQVALIDELQRNQKMQESISEKLEKIVLKRTEDLEKRNNENEMLLTEVHHRVKNNLQIISSLINLKARNASSESSETLLHLNGRIFSLGLIHEKLYQKQNFQNIQLDEYLMDVSRHVISSFEENVDSVSLRMNGKLKEEIDVERALTCGLITNELITNAVKYAFTPDQSDREILISIEQHNNIIGIQVSDNGKNEKPVSDSFKESFGLRFVDQLVTSKLNGHWDINVENGFHVTIKFKFNGERKD